ncbi:NAD(P)-dependent oxidoreductase [Calothrix sp. PCC 7507]|uniref:NAD(P)-dependent oxidoreductase n=1 Tax=Calothrix sp. PCC 7507 TaxID=99598 RepID=UPI0005AA6A70|nr:NAD(P)-dependent oxidoreductase [Calothrix sp. PCC 7507]
MAIQTVGILSPGDMGGAIAAVLNKNGMRTVAALNDRSPRTKQLAAAAKIENVGSLQNLVVESDLVLSVLVPSAATPAAKQVAEAIKQVGKNILYADCNAIAPDRVKAIEPIIQAAGGQFIDASIIGPPPRVPNRTRIYASGKPAGELEKLRTYGLDIRVIDDEIGKASGLKMCYAALTKGLTAIATELLIAAHRLDLDEVLQQELSTSQKNLLDLLHHSIPSMAPKAHRWVGEMEEIAATFGAVGLTERTFEGAADIYRFVKETSLGKEKPEERNSDRLLADIIAQLSDDNL